MSFSCQQACEKFIFGDLHLFCTCWPASSSNLVLVASLLLCNLYLDCSPDITVMYFFKHWKHLLRALHDILPLIMPSYCTNYLGSALLPSSRGGLSHQQKSIAFLDWGSTRSGHIRKKHQPTHREASASTSPIRTQKECKGSHRCGCDGKTSAQFHLSYQVSTNNEAADFRSQGGRN